VLPAAAAGAAVVLLLFPPVTTGSAATPPPCAPIALIQHLAAPQAGDLYLRAGSATCDTIEVEIAAHALAGIFTVAFDVAYPPALLSYEGYAQGPLLVRGPPRQAPFFLVRQASPGVLQVSMTRFAPDPPVAAEGSEGLVRLRFHRVAAGSAEVDFLAGSTSAIPEKVVDGQGQVLAARFGPDHGAGVSVP